MKLIVLDNYDSFTYNLVHIIRVLGYEVDVIRNDKITVEEMGKYDKIVLSPGPGIPDEAGIMKDVIRKYGPTKPILGVCLGHQGIAEVYGAELYNMFNVLHGVSSEISVVEDDYLFEGMPQTFVGCHYHSWAILQDAVGDQLKVTARDSNGNIMAITHKEYDVKGVQFHPESILTEHGSQMIENWLKH
ncbi:aminodeoxychorismate/anthranilate synthase component II [Fulvivirga sp. RKSG066]|uniref:anthranilate synthase component II n=1 Tax=Fulvivirga aurantia TaxID=2529383 RepID=UPI0012BBF88D|nr:aminodeoxychorismate/anthranilate synthase component II [Fulvivirga aurantia]MTI20416.1 aminodeoxychorismate/anthranilate synthase component II [Fulvivirga aurantia]